MKIIDLPSSNFDDRGAVVDMLVLHYTGMESAEAAYRRLCDRQAKVSAHYVVEENGRVRRLVAEDKRAWHAGVAHWRGHADINARSVGIELVNPGRAFGYRPFPEAQMKALIELCLGLLLRHCIPSFNVVGHSDVAPRRKEDPGELFDWPRLSRAGIGVWPEDDGPMADGPPRELLERVGYEMSDPSATIRAFQRRYRPDAITGEMDLETETLLRRLARLTQTLESVV